MDIVIPKIEAYAKNFSSVPDELLQQNERQTLSTHTHANMHSGLLQGKLLEMFSRMIKPVRILEIGTFTGFSALCLAKGLQPGGQLHTIEVRNSDAENARDYFLKAGMEEKIMLHIGDAHAIIPTLDEKWDLVFIDADKVSYIDYYELTLPFLNSGAWIIVDNVLYHGQVVDEQITGKNAIAIHAFNQHVAADNRVEQVLLTVRDGLTLIRKL